MPWTIEYYSPKIQMDIETLSKGLQARYIHLTRRMQEYGPHLKDRTLETAKKRMKEVKKNAFP